ncbi:MAG TPA: N-acetyl-gamma-glutamyl-phosphate reductase, partial [Candidatus Kapabacteria bacterium]
GYTGGELMRLVSRHPYVTLEKVFAKSLAGSLVSDVHAWHEKETSFEEYSSLNESDAEICFLALPHGEAMEVAPALLAEGKIVIDLSGDHRLKDTALFEKYYKKPQTSGTILNDAIYGLPEWNAEAIRAARFVSNPGCYATSAILPLAPVLVEGMIEQDSIIINSMSGVSGAGRKSAVEYSFVEVNENVRAYKIGDHQHIPEIETVLSGISNSDVKITFTPHLIPITRGIYSTMTAELSSGYSNEDVQEIFGKYYSNKPFVRITNDAPEVRKVANTNFIDIYAQVLPERNQLLIISTIDNIIKGAAGQAIQNMNLVCGFPETEGLR